MNTCCRVVSVSFCLPDFSVLLSSEADRRHVEKVFIGGRQEHPRKQEPNSVTVWDIGRALKRVTPSKILGALELRTPQVVLKPFGVCLPRAGCKQALVFCYRMPWLTSKILEWCLGLGNPKLTLGPKKGLWLQRSTWGSCKFRLPIFPTPRASSGL